jgi:hypothetical protein
MFRRLVKWIKIRYVFTDESLLAAIKFFGKVDRKLLNDEKLWKEVQYNNLLLKKEGLRRGLDIIS